MPLLASYGRDNVVVLVGAAAFLGAVASGVGGTPGWVIGGGAVALVTLTFWFFRDPERNIPEIARREGALIAPADGRIVQICHVVEPEFIGGDAVQVSIFLSLLDVHVNRVPVSGVVRLCRYVPGRFYAAYRSEASRRNEQMLVGIESCCGRLLLRQIAGVLARRIVCSLREGQNVRVGERFGMIKFGSRVDVLLPVGQAELYVYEGMKVRAGETLLGYLRPEPASVPPVHTLASGQR
ncbi:MAG: phosphatidylserine decarboxylase [Candidatus Kapabacteria bacterium]|nr:phosphatidylserine decarboxylase [Candidatus Kapabacteria bacterium]MCS7169022.1 phosphatidylserine decarboxylase [Candidatus Kapabacteria bacterium]MDW7997117.1 phosphatidylserine decarboxylase [Bacteroidota bacterium]MDW8225768.1 phosphatidylserine decarboxylase [Bacteroidota bacterium]